MPVKREPYGYSCLTDQKQFYQENYPQLAVENGSRTVKRLFADRRIPAQQREEHPALYDGTGRLLAVLGVAADWGFRPRPGERAITVVWEKEERSHELL